MVQRIEDGGRAFFQLKHSIVIDPDTFMHKTDQPKWARRPFRLLVEYAQFPNVDGSVCECMDRPPLQTEVRNDGVKQK